MDKRVLLMILDGFGVSKEKEHNAIELARKPNLERLMKNCAHSLIEASGREVGLPAGVMGNSEVGHLNIGAGRVIKQELSKIADFAKEKGFEVLPDVKRVFCEKKGSLHLLGLLSDGGVHSHIEHLCLLLEGAQRLGCTRPIIIDVFTDGRDTPPRSATKYVSDLQAAIRRIGSSARIGSIIGRYYAMDRDKRWERTELAYQALTGNGSKTFPVFATAEEAIRDAYNKGEDDEFIKPRLIKGYTPISADDSVLFFNFRADRARQICRALAQDGFKEFERKTAIQSKNLVTFTRYDETFPFPVLFSPSNISNILGEIVANRGEKQLRIAETEKYAHVTYFFNGGEEKVFPGEDRILIQSPKDVPTYDLKPEMSATAVTDALLKKMESEKYRLIVLNFANSDMVGHTGVEKAAIKAVEVLDFCIGRIYEECQRQGYDLLVTADHGNSECMVDPKTGQPHTAHTTNPVPLIYAPAGDSSKANLSDGILADIAPTILQIFGWQKPAEMTGHSLLK